MDKLRLGELLIQDHIITREQLEQAVQEQAKSGAKLGQVLISLGLITEDMLLNVLSRQLGIPIYDFKHFQLKPEITKLLSEGYARRFRAIVLEERTDEGLVVGMVDPLDITAVDQLKQVLSRSMHLVLVRESDLLRMLDMVYRHTDEISSYAEELGEKIAEEEHLLSEQGDVDAPVVKLLRSLFEDAVQVRASDIHIEPGDKVLSIRLRVDGMLQEQRVKEWHIAPALALRLKLIAGLNISERRLPQDGRFSIKVRGKVIDVRLSTLPTQYGESVVMRLLDQSSARVELTELGMSTDLLKRFRKVISSPYGILLVTGPTGSGKSTTLYAALNEINSSEKKIITVEDPVEYRLPRINQVQINEKIGLTFARVLRTSLRQDPDIIMVGEMRDQETAGIAIRAALTGHFVFSTLHTNDSASTALRLIDMNVEGFLVAATLRGVLAQRLVRRICESCKADSKLTDAQKNWLFAKYPELPDNTKFYYGKGCAYCNRTGFKGRQGVYELLELDEPMMDALRQKDPSKFTQLAMTSLKGRLLADNALDLAKQGVTTVGEVIRITGEV